MDEVVLIIITMVEALDIEALVVVSPLLLRYSGGFVSCMLGVRLTFFQ